MLYIIIIILKFMFSDQQPPNNFIYFLPAQHGAMLGGLQSPAIAILINNQEILSKQVQQIKNTIDDLQAELKQINEQRRLNEEFRKLQQCHLSKNGQTGRKSFAKDKKCPFQGCSKKYSSRIALNAHLRKAHATLRPKNIQQA